MVIPCCTLILYFAGWCFVAGQEEDTISFSSTHRNPIRPGDVVKLLKHALVAEIQGMKEGELDQCFEKELRVGIRDKSEKYLWPRL